MDKKSFEKLLSQGLDPQAITIIQMSHMLAELSIKMEAIKQTMDELVPGFNEVYGEKYAELQNKAIDEIKQTLQDFQKEPIKETVAGKDTLDNEIPQETLDQLIGNIDKDKLN
jgi:hypothetical protein